MNDVPKWAKVRAEMIIDEYNSKGWTDRVVPVGALNAFALYIARHEQPPTDPLLIEARNIAADYYEQTNDGSRRYYHSPDGLVIYGDGLDISKRYRDGSLDKNLNIALSALRRGIELGKENA